MQCSSLNKAGLPCRAAALKGQSVCHLHSAEGKAAIVGATKRHRKTIGSAANLKRFGRPSGPRQLQKILAQSVIDLRDGNLDARSVQAIAAAGLGFLRAFKIGRLAERVKNLETAHGVTKKR